MFMNCLRSQASVTKTAALSFTFLFGFVAVVLAAEPRGLEDPTVVFDFDTDSCYPDAAVLDDGKMNGGLKPTGDIVGECRNLEQLERAHTYHRVATIERDGTFFEVRMFALYFEKDQIEDELGGIFGELVGASHRHDWEYALLWLTDGELTHATVSSHGDAETKPISELHFDEGKLNAVKVVYHKDGAATHAFRFAKEDEKDRRAENETEQWLTPTLMTWETMEHGGLSNAELREKFNEHNFGKANCSFNDNHFPKEIAKSSPDGYPSGDEWREALGK